MQWNVHVKNEFGRDDNIAVDAESEIAAERAAAQHGSVAVVMGAYPADNTSAAVQRARDALVQLRDQQTGRESCWRAASADDRSAADGR